MLQKFMYKKCRKCGTPWLVRRMYKWGNDGTMGIKFRVIKRMVLLNASIYDDLVEELSEVLGIPIWDVVFESVRNAGRAALEDLFHDDYLLGKMESVRIVRRPTIEFYNDLCNIMGYAYAKTEKIVTRGKEGTAYIKNPFNLHCVAGAVVSALEALDHYLYDYSWEKKSTSEYLLTVKRTAVKRDIPEHQTHKAATILEEDASIERCPTCGMPRKAFELFEFQENEGMIINRKSKERFAAFVSTMLPQVFRQLADELGDEVYDHLVNTHCKWTIAHLSRLGVTGIDSILNSREAEQAFREYLVDFPIYGYGNPVDFTIGEESCSITIENPFFTEMLAGTLLGLYEGLFGRKADIDWKSIGGDKVAYTIMKKAS